MVLRNAHYAHDELLHGEIVAPEDREVVPDLVTDHQLGKCGEVRPPGLECADNRIQAEAFEERLGPDQVPDRNR